VHQLGFIYKIWLVYLTDFILHLLHRFKKWDDFWARSWNSEKRQLSSSCLSAYLFVDPSIRPHGTTRPPLDGFSWNLIIVFWNSAEKSHAWLNFDKNTGTLYKYLRIFMVVSCWILLRMRIVSDKSCRENINTHFAFNKLFRPRKSYRLWGVWHLVGIYCTARQATDDNVVHAHCMLDI